MAGKLFGSQRSLREANRANLLDTVHKYGAMTQVELAEMTGLSTATVSALVHELADEGRLETRSTVRNGRRATLVALAHDQGLAVGVAITRRTLDLVLLDSAKQILARHALPLGDGHRPDETLERAQMLLAETLETGGFSIDEVTGVGVALGAPVEKRSNMIAVPGLLNGWEDVSVADVIGNAYHVPVFVDNDANAAALCEARIGAASEENVRSFLYVQVSSGVGAGLISDGEVWRGVTGLAGEIGHVQVDPLGSICLCGNRGCLNTVVNEQRLTSLLEVTHGHLTMEDLVQKANDGDVGCRRVIEDAAMRVGDVTATTCIAFDPELIVIGGLLSQSGDAFSEPFSESLQRKLFPNVMSAIEVIPAKYPTAGAAIGAAIMAIENVERTNLAQQ